MQPSDLHPINKLMLRIRNLADRAQSEKNIALAAMTALCMAVTLIQACRIGGWMACFLIPVVGISLVFTLLNIRNEIRWLREVQSVNAEQNRAFQALSAVIEKDVHQ